MISLMKRMFKQFPFRKMKIYIYWNSAYIGSRTGYRYFLLKKVYKDYQFFHGKIEILEKYNGWERV